MDHDFDKSRLTLECIRKSKKDFVVEIFLYVSDNNW